MLYKNQDVSTLLTGSRLVRSVRRALPLRARGLRAPCASLLTFLLQNYYIAIAVHECWRQLVLVILGHLSFVKIENGCCQNRHYNINILFIYSEQITAFSGIENDQMTMTTLTTK